MVVRRCGDQRALTSPRDQLLSYGLYCAATSVLSESVSAALAPTRKSERTFSRGVSCGSVTFWSSKYRRCATPSDMRSKPVLASSQRVVSAAVSWLAFAMRSQPPV
ncbi:hypothetical protein D3C86_1154570 [compost metagenome]